jgi:hypothetical protein
MCCSRTDMSILSEAGIQNCNAVMVEASSRIGCLLTKPVIGSTSGDVSFIPQCNIQTTAVTVTLP